MRFTRWAGIAVMGFSIGCGASLAGGPSAAEPAPELAHLRLLVSLPPEELGGGTLVYAPTDPRPHSFLQMLTEGASSGDLGHVPRELDGSVARVVGELMPDSIAHRADRIFRTKHDLYRFLQEKVEATAPIEGVFHCAFPEVTELAVSAFHGNALLSFEGPVRVHDISMKDPGLDRLTLVSALAIHVEGERVEAGLISLVPGIGQVSFERATLVQGFVFSSLFPAGERLGEVQIAQQGGSTVDPSRREATPQ